MSRAAPRVWGFFYGSYINRAVLAEVGINPQDVQMARLDGFDIEIAPLANLVRAAGRCVYGVLFTLTHAELELLYAHAREELGGVYLPEAVLATIPGGALRPALCYIAPQLEPGPADPAYVQRIAKPARDHGFPDWYVAKLDSFAK